MASQIVTVYRNGDPTYPGRKLVVNRRQIRTMDALLDKVTKDIRMKQAARAIKTPTGRHTIKQLDKLEAGGCYVALGTERFIPLQYTEIKALESKHTPRKQIEITPVKHSRLQMSARAIKVAEAQSHSHKIIHVYRNGDDLYPSTKMLLDKRELSSMDTILKIVTSKVHLQSGAVFWLFSMEGREIKDPSQLENGGQYVAVGHGKKFKKVAYSDDGSLLSPRSRVPTKTQIKAANQKTSKPSKNKQHSYASSSQSKGYKRKTSSTSNSQASSHEDHTTTKPSEDIQDIMEEIQEDFISQPAAQFSPTVKRSPTPKESHRSPTVKRSPTPTESHRGVYEASGENQEKAKEVQDDREIKEDKPIDQLPAEEVDEEVEDETQNNNDKNKETKQEEERGNSGLGGFIGDLIDDVREKFDSDDEDAKKDPDKSNSGAKDNT